MEAFGGLWAIFRPDPVGLRRQTVALLVRAVVWPVARRSQSWLSLVAVDRSYCCRGLSPAAAAVRWLLDRRRERGDGEEERRREKEGSGAIPSELPPGRSSAGARDGAGVSQFRRRRRRERERRAAVL
ncbi:hypothetical protein KY290_016539 [Solanum tuberosum]|uniref:Uncharacterized protein n=1 Tax=Solanum tuberosum TaxID=4113 RepID=A0ABQ7V8T2_SOLTU|nr:hypothetical protein KY284_015821 [Solanum tuberosum]KAH0760466.1 hypothetical protein KY290_016539 [Solanum tuberosum]